MLNDVLLYSMHRTIIYRHQMKYKLQKRNVVEKEQSTLVKKPIHLKNQLILRKIFLMLKQV